MNEFYLTHVNFFLFSCDFEVSRNFTEIISSRYVKSATASEK